MISVVTNWLGYSCIAGVVFTFELVSLPPEWHLGQDGLGLIGALLLGGALAYITFCAVKQRQIIAVKKLPIAVPSVPLAGTQLALSLLRWPAEAATLYVLLRGQIEFEFVLSILLLNAVAGVLLHIPAGLGVLEAISIAVLKQRMPIAAVLAAVLVFRAVYYLVPLAIATLIYIGMETRLKPKTQGAPALDR
jgi:uncharacterized membrane protein YbhN (UPF0104 family)